MQTITGHVSTALTHHTEEPHEQWWASIDGGQSYLPINCKATDEDFAQVAALFEGRESEDGKSRFMQMRYARRCLHWKDIAESVEFFD